MKKEVSTNEKEGRPLLYLINPRNALKKMTERRSWNRLRIWPPLSLTTLAGLTPNSWEIRILDENLETFPYHSMRRPKLVGITAFTCQATRAYEVAAEFRRMGIPVVMGGIHASMCQEETRRFVDSVIIGEAETVWGQVLKDTLARKLRPYYIGTFSEWVNTAPARHDLVNNRYIVGSLQTTRGCPLGCSFCSVTAFNGRRFRRRPIKDVLDELDLISNKFFYFADDNLIGTSKEQMEYPKDLFRGMIKRGIRKYWGAQVTINIADDHELLKLAKRSGCMAVYIGFESTNPTSLKDIRKTVNLRFGIDNYKEAVRRIHRAGIGVTGAFIIGIDQDSPGAASLIVKAVKDCQIDAPTILTLTPLPGTRLHRQIVNEGRMLLTNYPHDWQYYNLIVPTHKFRHFTWSEMRQERDILFRELLRSRFKIWIRSFQTLLNTKDARVALLSLLSNLSYRRNWYIYEAMLSGDHGHITQDSLDHVVPRHS